MAQITPRQFVAKWKQADLVGFSGSKETRPLLDGRQVDRINADLTASVDLTQASVLVENKGICLMGPSPKAPFDIDMELASRMLAAPLNINGRPNSDVVRPVARAVDLVQRPRNKWTIEFAVMSEGEAWQYEMPFEYVRRRVLPVRANRRDDYRGFRP